MYIFETSLFGFTIAPTWYGLMYALGFIICYIFMKYYGKIPENMLDTLLLYIFFGVILGGRIGYVILYGEEYFIKNPIEILAIWKGGMSFHGGLIGVIISLSVFSVKYKKYSFFDISDRLALCIPIALGFGRIGNYINNELPGFSPYDGPWAMIIGGIPHFPSPLLQAFLEGIILLIILWGARLFLRNYTQFGNGVLSGLFLLGYGTIRIIAEFFRNPDIHIGYLGGTDWLTLGMIYSTPMMILGLFLLYHGKKTTKAAWKTLGRKVK